METKQQNKMNGRKTANDVLIASFRVGVIASAGVLAILLACAGRWRGDCRRAWLVRVGSRAPVWSGGGSA